MNQKQNQNRKSNHNIHKIVCNFVEKNGPQSWSNLHKVVLIAAGRNLNEKNWGVAYLDFVSPSSVMFPKADDNRYLVKSHVDGLYHLVVD